MEDSDIGLMAWKRGWRILYQPKSRVWHEHRGTIGKRFSRSYINGGDREECDSLCLEKRPFPFPACSPISLG